MSAVTTRTRGRLRPAWRRPDRDGGQVAVEFLGTIGYLLLAALAALQLLLAVATVQAVSVASRAAARTVSQASGSAEASARAAVPGWLSGDLRVRLTGGSEPGVQVSAPVKTVLPGFTGPRVTREAWFPAEYGRAPWGP